MCLVIILGTQVVFFLTIFKYGDLTITQELKAQTQA
jgi:hypothetical protein